MTYATVFNRLYMDCKTEKLYSEGLILPVVECFYSLQGEGYNSGKPAFFIRLCGCNVKCSFCDSKNSWSMDNATWIDIETLADKVEESGANNVVVTGGEPLIHNLNPLCELLHSRNKALWLETSASLPLSGSWDWICVSPKEKILPLKENYAFANELKVVISSADDLSKLPAFEARVSSETKLYLQPEWDSRSLILPQIIDYIKENTRWALSLQIHKWLEIE